ncbi:class I adenylate-forming enzyme family protein [Niveispirillum sp.]|uniref:class I adenylate-forming enzyme family protein n=1 Tax=Niveispirillum sp. TaxID=1917217 RepID=UPI001B68089C|nr:class I adenylate-forming enzyme family protein [Niveispirillum sp.]MBP7339851.1 acyl--CoA ligase [Niveispirillum sp.]
MTQKNTRPEAGNTTIAGLLAGQAVLTPDAVFGIFPDSQITYGALHARALAMAKGLVALGIRPGDHVATLMPNCADWLPCFFAGLYAGAVMVPLNARYKRHELSYAIAHCQARMLFTTDAIDDHVDFVGLLEQTLPHLTEGGDAGAPDLRHAVLMGRRRHQGFLSEDTLIEAGKGIADSAVDNAWRSVAPEDAAVIIYTSGTTSAPKGCVLSHAGIQRSWYTFAETVDLSAADRIWMPMPFFHTGGVGPMTAVLSRGAAFMTQPHFEPEGAVDLIRRHRIAHLYSGFPQMSLTVLQHPSYSREAFGFVRSMLNVGPPATQQAIQRLLPPGAVLLNLFGMTEGAGIITFTPADTPVDLRAVTSGRPPHHTEIRIFDPDSGTVCPPEVMGEIQFRGGGAFLNYYRDPDATTAAILAGGWVRTGDRGRIDADGWLHYAGRLKDMLKVGGENVAAAEIEFFLTRHPDVKMVQVIGAPDARMGEVPVAFVERIPGGTVTQEALIAMCQGELARWKIPRAVVFVDEWPMSSTKVQKFRLRALLPEPYRTTTIG